MNEMGSSFQWANDANPVSLTPKFIVPDENKPNLTKVADDIGSIPIIDMNEKREVVVEEIAKACENFGFFQVINHGIPMELCENVLDVITKFFQLPCQEKAPLVSDRHMDDGKIFKYFIKDQITKDNISMWGEAFFHTWHPIHHASYAHNLPPNPPHYREIIGAYAKEIGVLITKLLSLISQSLGLDESYLDKMFNLSYTAQANYYPPCPNPQLTLGLRDHTDFNILTILLQEEQVTGLQVLKDGNWVAVKPFPNALVINVGDQLQVLSNDRYKSVRHRAVTNEVNKRTSFAMFVGPHHNDFVSPISDLLDQNHPPLYRRYTFGEFIQEFRNQEGKSRMVTQVFRISS